MRGWLIISTIVCMYGGYAFAAMGAANVQQQQISQPDPIPVAAIGAVADDKPVPMEVDTERQELDRQAVRRNMFKALYDGLTFLNDTSSLSSNEHVIVAANNVAYDLGVFYKACVMCLYDIAQDPAAVGSILLQGDSGQADSKNSVSIRIDELYEACIKDLIESMWAFVAVCEQDYTCSKGCARGYVQESLAALRKELKVGGNEEIWGIGLEIFVHEILLLIVSSKNPSIGKRLSGKEKIYVQEVINKIHLLEKKTQFNVCRALCVDAFWDGYHKGSCWWRFKRGVGRLCGYMRGFICKRIAARF